MSFQSLILDLQSFWARQGCVILQPYDVEVGAGTFHPATALRALGPEPWRAAYVQPSRRPTDGRYGDKVKLLPVTAGRRRWPLLRRLPFVEREPSTLIAELADWVEARLLWARFGL